MALLDRIDGSGKTLLPGLIDAHVHTRPFCPDQAILFGVTTELDLMTLPYIMLSMRKDVSSRADVADVLSSSICCTVPGGWPTQLIGTEGMHEFPTLRSVSDVAEHVRARIY